VATPALRIDEKTERLRDDKEDGGLERAFCCGMTSIRAKQLMMGFVRNPIS